MKNAVFLSQKSWWKYDIHILLTSSCFNLLRDGKHGLFLSQKVDVKMIFTGYWNVLVLIFSGMRNTVFFEPKSWWKHHIYWFLRSSCFELSGDGKYCLFSAKKLMKRWYLRGLFELSMIFQVLGNMVFRAALQPMDLHVSLKLSKKSSSYNFSRILFMKGYESLLLEAIGFIIFALFKEKLISV